MAPEIVQGRSEVAFLRVLVVEDDAMVRSILIEYMEAFGFVRICAPESSRQAVRLLSDQNERFDIVISDWQMPAVDGLDLLKLIRQLPFRRTLKFIMVTGQSQDERAKVIKAKNAGVDAYIVKPFKGTLLREKVFSVLGLSAPSGGNGTDDGAPTPA